MFLLHSSVNPWVSYTRSIHWLGSFIDRFIVFIEGEGKGWIRFYFNLCAFVLLSDVIFIVCN